MRASIRAYRGGLLLPVCPLAELGIGTREDCGDCTYFMEMDGFEVVCSCQEPIEEDVCHETSID